MHSRHFCVSLMQISVCNVCHVHTYWSDHACRLLQRVEELEIVNKEYGKNIKMNHPSPEQLFTPSLSKLIQPKVKQTNVHRFGRFQPNPNSIKLRCKSYYQLNEARERTKAMVSLINKVSSLYTTSLKRRANSIDKLSKFSQELEPPSKKNPTPAGIMAPRGSEDRRYVFIIQPLELQHTTDFKPISQSNSQKILEAKFKPSYLSKKGRFYIEPHGLIEEIACRSQNLRGRYKSCFLADTPSKRFSYFLPNSKNLNLNKIPSKGNLKPYQQPNPKPANSEKPPALNPLKYVSDTHKQVSSPDLQNVTKESKKVLISHKSNACVNTTFEENRDLEKQSNLYVNITTDTQRRSKIDSAADYENTRGSHITSETLCDKYKPPELRDVSIFNDSEYMSGWNISKSPRNHFEETF